jgi:3'(2'), 5'-bisphosphate nucleotidase
MNSSLKLCKVADGFRCIYPKFSTTWEWDIAASDIILQESKSTIMDQKTNEHPLYNKTNIKNNSFIAMDNYFLNLNK